MTKDVLETLKATVEKNIKIVQNRIDSEHNKAPQSGATLNLETLRFHHTIMRYAKLLMSIENRLASLK